ncbi:alpha/beta fold hydrolase [Polaribacter sp. MED152]|uniref:alpha/beta fold hydrolase n=1 Tax=Polaribacter sp. MED152 TaxID=313598 RepID=UPI0000689AD7|nr:alpha/beta hydrolase [Polaribacter sp. MED152]EAQ40765.1 alpha/beta hydrolase [Polaribacter sp. MED152]
MKPKSSKRKYWLYTLLIALILAINSVVYSDIFVDELKVEYANQYSKFIEIDGMQVHYRIEGEGFPIVLIHGTASSLHTWDAWTKELKKTNTIIRMDLPAFGLTGPNKTADYSIKSYTTFLDQFLNEIAIDSFHLAGNSLGGNIAWNYAAEHPNKVDKLILVDASGLPTNKPQPAVFKMAKTPVVSNLFLYVTPKFFINKNMQEVYADDTKITDDLVSRYHKMALREGNRQAFIDRARMDFKLGSKANIDKLKSIQNSTLLIWGAQDNWIPLDNGKRMDSVMHNSKLAVLENSGHVPMEENPEESLAILKSFLND